MQNNCTNCKKNLYQSGNFEFLNRGNSDLRGWQELIKCPECQRVYVVRHEIFTKQGHIFPSVFIAGTTYPNENNDWWESYDQHQLDLIYQHLKKCSKCQVTLNEILKNKK